MGNKFVLQIVDEGGPTVALHIYTEGDLHHGVGALASELLAIIVLRMSDEEVNKNFPSEVKEMLRFHLLEEPNDTEEDIPKPNLD